MDMPGTNVRLEPPRMATNKSRGGPWGWDVTPRGKRGCVDAASRVRLLYEGREHLIFGAPFLLSGQQRWSRRSGSPADSGSMLALKVKGGAVGPGGESWYTRRCYPWGRKAGNACSASKWLESKGGRWLESKASE